VRHLERIDGEDGLDHLFEDLAGQVVATENGSADSQEIAVLAQFEFPELKGDGALPDAEEWLEQVGSEDGLELLRRYVEGEERSPPVTDALPHVSADEADMENSCS